MLDVRALRSGQFWPIDGAQSSEYAWLSGACSHDLKESGTPRRYLIAQCNQLPEKQYHYSSAALLSAVVAVDSGAGRSGRAVVVVVVAVVVVAVL